jgi:predicted GNAT superfamily acetyltransferase
MTRSPLHLVELHDMDDLRAVSDLFSAVWGRGDEGAPIPSEVLRGLIHAGGLVNAAYAAPPAPGAGSGELLGAAVLAPSADGGGYSMIAAALPGHSDKGIGTALKEHQRAWAAARGMATITWTFDPLVARNGHFNLDKLGANAPHYERSFYGAMGDAINGNDDSDRLVAVWSTTAPTPSQTPSPTSDGIRDHSASLLAGPDGHPAYLSVAGRGERWVRVPADIVATRRDDPAAATRWRGVVREAMEDALAQGLVATGVSRDQWYRFTTPATTSHGRDDA